MSHMINYGIDSEVAQRIIDKSVKARRELKEGANFEAIKNAKRMLAWFEHFFMEIIDLDKIDVEVKLVEIDQDGNQKTEA